MNNSVMKCCICSNEKSGEFITINDKKYHLCCIEQLQKQYIDLKERYNNMFECHCNRVQVEQLQNNWNELKNRLESWLENDKHCYLAENPSDKCRCEVYKELLDKMQEMEQGKDVKDNKKIS